jgi:hypothetical protein
MDIEVDLVFVLKGSATSSSLAAPIVKMEQTKGILVEDVKGTFPREFIEKILALTSMSTPGHNNPLCPCHTGGTSLSLGSPPSFDSLHKFQFHLEEEYEGFRLDQI